MDQLPERREWERPVVDLRGRRTESTGEICTKNTGNPQAHQGLCKRNVTPADHSIKVCISNVTTSLPSPDMCPNSGLPPHMGFRLFQDCSSAPKNYAECPDKVLERTFQILELASETWLVTGRQPIPMITAAVYLSWQSLKPVQRRSCTFSQFCKLSETEKPPPAVLRLKELKEVCLKLSAQLPWLKRLTINMNNVVYHLGDILKHRTYLLRKALEDVEMATTRSEESKSSDLQHPSAAFLPPCMTKPRKRSHALAFPNKLQDITGDEEISDSEIEQYLRTPAEMACFQQAQTRLVL
ncbi:unnamed protein product [Ranitomeya imitator]|uniref:BRF2-like C-terminal domain-containing protein n=1 Tax=Ranitomeya imitator TaxID=111125 RepID=A0ABN9M1M6_9NEOB|nr:unnamed protein product [Ranitomeya imitator]